MFCTFKRQLCAKYVVLLKISMVDSVWSVSCCFNFCGDLNFALHPYVHLFVRLKLHVGNSTINMTLVMLFLVGNKIVLLTKLTKYVKQIIKKKKGEKN